MTDGPIVSEEDREAAATLCEHIENDKGEPVSSWAIDLIRAGKADHHCTVQAFARHRLSTQSAMQARIEKLETLLRQSRAHLFAGLHSPLTEQIDAALSNIGSSNDG